MSELFLLRSPAFKLSIVLVLITVAVYVQVGSHGFIHYDDYRYVVNNNHVNTGLSVSNLLWAFTEVQFSNWHPLTWVSHMIDVELFGLDAGYHHLVNLLLHISNGLLLFFFLKTTTGQNFSAFIVSVLFLVHPTHVESVAWIAERKDLLSTFFFLLTILAYTFYVKSKTLINYLTVLCFLLMSLMSKPMVVTLPFVLLLLDIWPLRRIEADKLNAADLMKLVIEKIPFFLVILGSSILTYVIQNQSGAMGASSLIDVGLRIENALVSYIRYLIMAFYPGTLTIFYPHVLEWSSWVVLASAVVLFSISATAIYKFREVPWFFVGWFFFLGTLIPVIGVVQVGIQSIADRYTYIPYIGIFIVLSWFIGWLKERYSEYKKIILLIIGLFVIVNAFQANRYLDYWKYDVLLFRHALETHDPGYQDIMESKGEDAGPRKIYGGLYVMYFNLGVSLYAIEMFDEAKVHFIEAIRILPKRARPRYMLGESYFSTGDYKLAYDYISQAMMLDPERKPVYLKRLSDISLLLKKNKPSGSNPIEN